MYLILLFSKVKLPVIDDSGELETFDDLDRQISRSVSPISTNIKITKSAIAGIVGDELVTMELSKIHVCIHNKQLSVIFAKLVQPV